MACFVLLDVLVFPRRLSSQAGRILAEGARRLVRDLCRGGSIGVFVTSAAAPFNGDAQRLLLPASGHAKVEST